MHFAIALLLLESSAVAVQEPASPEPAAPERGLIHAGEGSFQGYTLFAPLRSNMTYLVDMRGEAVHSWKGTSNPGNSVYLLDDGHLLRAGKADNSVFSGGGSGGRVQKYTWEGELVWDYVHSNDEYMHHHDVEPLPNGNILLISWEAKTRREALLAGRDRDHIAEDGFWPDYVVEIAPDGPTGGKVVWEWHTWDHLVQDIDPKRANYGDVREHPELIDINADWRDGPPTAEEVERQREIAKEMAALGYTGDDDEDEDAARTRSDWLHTNGIDYDPVHDRILLSVRMLSEVWVIDHSTTTVEAASHAGGKSGHGGDLLYRWGNPMNYGLGAAGDRRLFVQHDAQWIPEGSPGAGNITIFNNGEGRGRNSYSSVEEVELPLDENGHFDRTTGNAFGPVDAVWSYSAADKKSFFSSFISGTQRLPNGNTLICSGAQARIFEVTKEGDVVWDYLNPFVGQEGARGQAGRNRRGDGPQGERPQGERPAGGDRAGRGRPGDRRPRGGRPGQGGPRGGRGGGGMVKGGLFRATRIAPEHPALVEHLLNK